MSTIQQQLSKTRKPRVHIQYEVESEGGVENKELPFVVGVIGDYCGDSPKANLPLKEREFVEINRDNFNRVMQSFEPQLNLRVKNTLRKDDSEIAMRLKFNSIADFEPDSLVRQIPSLNALLTLRSQLKELLSKTDCSYELENILESVLQDKQKLLTLSEQLTALDKQ